MATPTACGTSSCVMRRIFSRMNSAIIVSIDWSVGMSRGNQRGPVGRKRTTASANPSRLKPETAERTTSSSKSASCRAMRELARDLLALREVGLGDDEQLLRLGLGDVGGDPLVALADRLGRVDEQRDDVDVLERLERRAVQLLAERVVGLVKPGRVDDDDLRVIAVEHRPQAVPRGLRRVRGDGDLGADGRVGQRGLAGVRASDQSDEAALGLERGHARRVRHATSSRLGRGIRGRTPREAARRAS